MSYTISPPESVRLKLTLQIKSSFTLIHSLCDYRAQAPSKKPTPKPTLKVKEMMTSIAILKSLH